jgi:hypothetical protein
MSKIILAFLMLVLVLLVATPGYVNLNAISKAATGDALNDDNHAITNNDCVEPHLAAGLITCVVGGLIGITSVFFIETPVGIPIYVIGCITIFIGIGFLFWWDTL